MKEANFLNDFVANIFSRESIGEIANLIKSTYISLTKIVSDSGQFSAEDLEIAAKKAESNQNNDLTDACNLFEYVKIGRSGPTSTLYTTRLISFLTYSDAPKKLDKSLQEMKTISGAFLEFRACSFAIKQQRNYYSHDNRSSVSKVQSLFLASCVSRLFELAQLLNQLRGVPNDTNSKAETYFSHLWSICAASVDGLESEIITPVSSENSYNLPRLMEELSDQSNQAAKELGLQTKRLTKIEKLIERRDSQTIDRINELLNKVSQSINDVPICYPNNEKIYISKGTAESELVMLRDRIYKIMSKEYSEYKPYNNILQRPIIYAALGSCCSNLDMFLGLDALKNRMERNKERFFKRQVDLFGQEIDTIFRKIDYSIATQDTDPDEVPF